MKKVVFALACLALSGCALNPDGSINWGASFNKATANINNANQQIAKYAPLVGKDLLVIGNIIVQAECSPLLNPTTQAAETTLKILAPTSAAASTAQSALVANAAIAAQLCPLYQSIYATVGAVPATAPSGAAIQAIPLTAPVPPSAP